MVSAAEPGSGAEIDPSAPDADLPAAGTGRQSAPGKEAVPGEELVGSIMDGRYEILSLIARGGMSSVYKARHKAMDQLVAVKILREDLTADSKSLRRFQQEARAVTRLKHPRILSVYAFGVSAAGQPYLVMDYLQGKTLAQTIAESGTLSVELSLTIALQILEGLEVAHAQNIVHRDIKPGNVMLIESKAPHVEVKLLDFGIARMSLPCAPVANAYADRQTTPPSLQNLTQKGEVFGTPAYMSPEQCRGEQADCRSDLYSLGCILYESLSGSPLFSAGTPFQLMYKQLEETPPRLSLPGATASVRQALQAVLLKALAKDPAHRYQNSVEMRADLEKCLAPDPDLHALGASVRKVPNKPRLRPTSRLLLAVTCILLVPALLIAGSLHSRLNPGPSPPANPSGLLSDEDPTTAITAMSSGRHLLSDLDRLPQAEQDIRRAKAKHLLLLALQLDRTEHVLHASQLFDIYSGLGYICHWQPDKASQREAETYLKMMIPLRDPDDADQCKYFAESLFRLGETCTMLDKKSEAESYYKQAASVAEKFGEQSMYVWILNALLVMYTEDKRTDLAAAVQAKIDNAIENNLARPCQPAAAALFQKARNLESERKYALAEKSYKEAITEFEGLGEPASLDACGPALELGRMEAKMGKYSQAADHLGYSAARCQQRLGRKSHEFAEVSALELDALRKANRLSEAAALEKKLAASKGD